MKTNFTTKERLQRSFSGGAAIAGLLLLGGVAANAQPFASPAGTVWDVSVSGSRSGVGLVEFLTIGTVSILEFVVPNKTASSSISVDSGRNGGGDSSRTGPVNNSSGSRVIIPMTSLFGAEV